MEIKYLKITPETAKKYLKNNDKNRKVRRKIVERYATDMLEGRWKEGTGDTMKISIRGILLDGQHRLLALIKANKSFYFHVAFDVNEQVMDVLDTGAARIAADSLYIEGIASANSKAAIIKYYRNLKADYAGTKHLTHTNQEILNDYAAHMDFWDETQKQATAWYLSLGRIVTTTFIGAFYAVFHDIDQNAAFQFFDILANGNGNEPMINLLRSKLINNKVSQKKIPEKVRNALLCKTWNMWRKGEKTQFLRYNAESDNFPEPI